MIMMTKTNRPFFAVNQNKILKKPSVLGAPSGRFMLGDLGALHPMQSCTAQISVATAGPACCANINHNVSKYWMGEAPSRQLLTNWRYVGM